MEYLDAARHPVWKALLREGRADRGLRGAGRRRARTHPCSARPATGVAALFPTDAIFHAIRLEPYLLATAERHPALRAALRPSPRGPRATKLPWCTAT